MYIYDSWSIYIMLIFYHRIYIIYTRALSMENRKVQRVGYSTLSISLPSDWVKDVGLKKGDFVVCKDEKDGSLVVMPRALIEDKKREKMEEYIVNSDLCTESRMLERAIVGNYVLGRDIITVTASKRIKDSHMEEIRGAVRRLMGIGMIEENVDRIVLQCSIDPKKFPIYKLMRRLYTIVSIMQKEAVEAFITSDPSLAKEVIQRENDADTMYWLVIRLLLTAQQNPAVAEDIGLENRIEIVGNRLIAKYLETIADYAENIAKTLLRAQKYKGTVSKPINDSLTRMSGLAGKICKDAVNCIFSKDVSVASCAIEITEDVEKEEEKLMKTIFSETQNVSEVADLRTIVWSLRRIAEYGAGIAEVAINRDLEISSKICSLSAK